MSRLVYLIVFCVLMLISCGDPTIIKFSPDYSYNRTNIVPSCAVYVNGNSIIHYSGNVKDEFGEGNTETLIDSFLHAQLPVDVKQQARVKNATAVAGLGSYKTERVQLDVSGRGVVNLIVPAAGTRLEQVDADVDFVFIFSDLEIESQWEGYVTPGGYVGNMYTPGSFSSSKNLTMRGKYILWDNSVGKLVSYGYVEAVDENTFAVTKEDWLEVVKTFVDKAISGTPLAKT